MSKPLQPGMLCMVFGHPLPENNGNQVTTKQLLQPGERFVCIGRGYIWEGNFPVWLCNCPSQRCLILCEAKHLFPIDDGEFTEIEEQQEVTA